MNSIINDPTVKRPLSSPTIQSGVYDSMGIYVDTQEKMQKRSEVLLTDRQ